jgi:hypothetical protein
MLSLLTANAQGRESRAAYLFLFGESGVFLITSKQ